MNQNQAFCSNLNYVLKQTIRTFPVEKAFLGTNESVQYRTKKAKQMQKRTKDSPRYIETT